MSTEKVRKSMTFDRKLFFSIGSLFIVFIAIILLFEYNLEKENRQQSLNALLQDYNELIYSQIKNKEIDQISIDSIIQSITRKPLRVTIIWKSVARKPTRKRTKLHRKQPFGPPRNKIISKKWEWICHSIFSIVQKKFLLFS